MFTKRTIKPHQTVTSADTAMDALAVSIGERACVDLRFMAQLTGKTEDALIGELRGVIFKDPLASGEPYEGWQTADEYLSGNVRQKLRVAEVYAASDPAYQANVEALTAAQPKDLDASEIEVRLGATWIDKQYIQQFMKHELLLKGEMTHKTDLGQDPRGNLVRIDNALAGMPERLVAVKAQLDNLFAQQAAAKEEVGKPFPQEDELRQKSARLAELDSLLNIDGRHGQEQEEQAIAKSARPSLLEGLKRPAQPGPDTGRNRKPYQER